MGFGNFFQNLASIASDIIEDISNDKTSNNKRHHDNGKQGNLNNRSGKGKGKGKGQKKTQSKQSSSTKTFRGKVARDMYDLRNMVDDCLSNKRFDEAELYVNNFYQTKKSDEHTLDLFFSISMARAKEYISEKEYVMAVTTLRVIESDLERIRKYPGAYALYEKNRKDYVEFFKDFKDTIGFDDYADDYADEDYDNNPYLLLREISALAKKFENRDYDCGEVPHVAEDDSTEKANDEICFNENLNQIKSDSNCKNKSRHSPKSAKSAKSTESNKQNKISMDDDLFDFEETSL